MIVAAPVLDDTANPSRVLGAMVVLLKSLPAQRNTPAYILRVAGTALLLFTVAAGAAGTLFGSLTARGLVGRFRRLSSAANAWSQGDFSAAVDLLTASTSPSPENDLCMSRALLGLGQEGEALAIAGPLSNALGVDAATRATACTTAAWAAIRWLRF